MVLNIIETTFEEGLECDGTYLEDLIVVKDINNKNVLIHEGVHYLWDKKDPNLKAFLKKFGLKYTSKTMRAMNNHYIKDNVDTKFIMNNYKSMDWFEEAVAYWIGDASEEIIRGLNISLLNDLLDDEFYYYDGYGDYRYAKDKNTVLLNDVNKVSKLLGY